MIRVLEVLATLKRAGAETMVTSLACGLDRTKFDPAVVTLFDATPGDLEAQVQSCGVPVRRLGKMPGLDVRMFTRLRRAIAEFEPHVIHTHSYVMRYVLPVARSPIVHTVHNLASQEVDAFGKLVHRVAFRRGVTPVAVAHEVAKSFAEVYGFRPDVIPNGIDVARFDLPRPASAEPVILSVARLEEQKNPLLLTKAFSRIPAPWRLRMAGEGSLRPRLEGIERVELLGARSDIPELLACAAIFAISSNWEGHPISVMEAMAAGLPIIATKVGGIPEIAGDAALLVPPDDLDAFAAALQRLTSDASLREDLGRKARERSRQFDVRHMIDAYSSLFERVAG